MPTLLVRLYTGPFSFPSIYFLIPRNTGVSVLSHAVNKTPDESNLREEAFLLAYMGRPVREVFQLRQQEHEVTLCQ